ncbi:hypothetical protein BHE74_00015311 [Ensete ventricosum]|nr:hypothetical protein BHE74_00015311 [Ensete ventricosum]
MEVGDITQRNEPDMIGSRRLCCSLRFWDPPALTYARGLERWPLSLGPAIVLPKVRRRGHRRGRRGEAARAVRCGTDGPGKRRRASRADPSPDPVRSVEPFQCSSSERPQRDLNGGVGFCVITASDSVGSRAAQLLQRNMTRGASASVSPLPRGLQNSTNTATARFQF